MYYIKIYLFSVFTAAKFSVQVMKYTVCDKFYRNGFTCVILYGKIKPGGKQWTEKQSHRSI